jgi:hypothetical protein
VSADLQGKLIGYGAIALLVQVPALAVWAMRRRRLAEQRESVAAATPLAPGHVRLIFHTYSGFLFSCVQQTHDVVLPADDAAAMLKRLVRHNLTRGIWFIGGPLVPVFTWVEYRAQRRKIAAAREATV